MLRWFRETGGDAIAWVCWRFYAWCFKKEGKSRTFWFFTTALAYLIMIAGWGLCIFGFYFVYIR